MHDQSCVGSWSVHGCDGAAVVGSVGSWIIMVGGGHECVRKCVSMQRPDVMYDSYASTVGEYRTYPLLPLGSHMIDRVG